VPQTGKINATWFQLHRWMNVLALLMALTAVILIFVRFQWSGRAATATYYTGQQQID
jgi:flagellar biosynthesis/type III secretory pathway M-ring protein FliF/YscJ